MPYSRQHVVRYNITLVSIILRYSEGNWTMRRFSMRRFFSASVPGSMSCLYPVTFQGTSANFRRPLISSRPTMPSFNPFSSNTTINTDRSSSRLPTYTSLETVVPAYTSNEQGSTSAHDRARAWGDSLPSASSQASQYSEAVFRQPESLLTDTVSVGETFVEMTRPAGPRYGKISCYPYHNLLNVINSLSLLPNVRRGWGNSVEKPRLL